MRVVEILLLVLLGGGDDELRQRVPRMDTPEAQLAHARRLKRRSFAQAEDQQRFWRQLAIEAYQSLRVHHPDSPGAVAEGSFRAAELLRASGQEGEALGEFERSSRVGGVGEFGTRARLEIGHVHRRAGRGRRALDAYLAVASEPGADPRHRDDAWLWAGRVWLDDGRVDDARRAWRGVCESGADPLDRVQAWDWCALSWLDAGDPEAAAGVLNECLRALSAVALEESELGERVRNALLRMRVIEELRRAIEDRTRERAETPP